MPWRAGGPDLAGSDVELHAVPRAGHLVTSDRALRQRPIFMRAGVLEGVEVAINVEHGEPLAVDVDPSGLTGREFVCLGDFQKLSHRLILQIDRKSTRLNSSHLVISYAVFCLKKKKKNKNISYDVK